jgi:pilus assembly protein FimV
MHKKRPLSSLLCTTAAMALFASVSASAQGPGASSAPAASTDAGTPAAASGEPVRNATAGAAPRLRLDAAEGVGPPAAASADAAVQAIEQANAAVLEAIASTRAAAQRVATMEQDMARLRAEAQAQRELVAQLQARSPADAGGASALLLPLLLALLAMASLAAWLWWRLRALEQERGGGWAQRVAAAAAAGATPSTLGARSAGGPVSQAPGAWSARSTSPVPLRSAPAPVAAPAPVLSPPRPAAAPPRAGAPVPVSPPRPAPATAAGTSPGSARRADARGDRLVDRDADLPTSERSTTAPLAAVSPAHQGRDVSIEELIDLEQQAEFFVVLGQDDAAIDLLVEHLRQTGGVSPLPYLKLLEIYRRLDDRDAYERTRSRFNRRFNAYAPDWHADLKAGRTLEDYPRVMGWLQHVWPRPIDAMAELEALLFRKDGGELFDLPAYAEVLFLYALARDVLDHDSVATGSVDVLLPLNDDAGGEQTVPQPFLAAYPPQRPSAASDDRPTAPIDFDLGPAPSGFDSLFGLPEEPPRKR